MSLLTTTEAAAYLNVTESCIRRWVLEKKLAHVKLGRLLRFERDVLDAFVSASRVESKPSHVHPTRPIISARRASPGRRAKTPSDLRKRWLEKVQEAG